MEADIDTMVARIWVTMDGANYQVTSSTPWWCAYGVPWMVPSTRSYHIDTMGARIWVTMDGANYQLIEKVRLKCRVNWIVVLRLRHKRVGQCGFG